MGQLFHAFYDAVGAGAFNLPGMISFLKLFARLDLSSLWVSVEMSPPQRNLPWPLPERTLSLLPKLLCTILTCFLMYLLMYYLSPSLEISSMKTDICLAHYKFLSGIEWALKYLNEWMTKRINDQVTRSPCHRKTPALLAFPSSTVK